MLKIDTELEERQIQRVRKMKRERNSAAVKGGAEARRRGLPLGRESDGADLRSGAPRAPPSAKSSDIFRTEFGVYTDPGWI